MSPSFNAALQYVLNRLSEKSTWVSLGSLLTAVGIVVKPDLWAQVMAIGMGLGGLIGILLPARVQEKNIAPSSEPTRLSVSTELKQQ